MTVAERKHWQNVTRDRDWKRQHIADPNICTMATVNAITQAFPTDPKRILEIGVGFGRLASVISALYPEAEVIGTDISMNTLAHGLEGVKYRCQDNLDNIEDQDAIYSVAVFQHLPTDEKRDYINQAHDALRMGGVLRIQFIEGDRDNFNDHWISADDMANLFSDTGFLGLKMNRMLVHPQWTWITGVKE